MTNDMDKKKFIFANNLNILIILLGALLIVLISFKGGLMVGMRKADFSCGWGDNYHRNFGGPKGGFFRQFGNQEMMEADGTFGQILQIDAGKLIIQGPDEMEKIILITDQTVIKRFVETIKYSDLKIDDYVVIIGEPNRAGQIEAKLIRVLPPPGPDQKFGPPPPQHRPFDIKFKR